MAKDRFSKGDIPPEKVVTRADLALIIEQLEDVSYRKAAQCTELAFYNKLPDIEEQGLVFQTLEDYYTNFLSYTGQKPYVWYVNRALKKINKLRPKDTIQIYSKRYCVKNSDGTITQRAKLFLFNELGMFIVRSDVNVNTGRGTNEVSFLSVSDEVYKERLREYKKEMGGIEAEQKALEMDGLLYQHRHVPFCGRKTIRVRSEFSIDTSIECDEFAFVDLKEQVEISGGIENVAFLDAEWLQKCPTERSHADNYREEVETCYQIGFCFGDMKPKVKVFKPITLCDLKNEKKQACLENVGVSLDRYNEIVTLESVGRIEIGRALAEIADRTNLLIVSSKSDLTLIQDYLSDFCSDSALKEKMAGLKFLVTQELFIGYFTPRVQTLARLCGVENACHTFDAGDDVHYLATTVKKMIQYGSIQAFFEDQKESMDKDLKEYFDKINSK